MNIDIENITQTVEGYPVKDLSYKPVDNIITGRVQCPVTGKPSLHDGYVTCVWNYKGSPLDRYGGKDRRDLALDF